ncbi:hypothetical protein DKX38_002708 [Salix brachista]|uniref:Uncharacterized protein n=1 Tax=Salix brachista TaxID=2182728 RepID=A0A5N5NMT2_9ROSI|nr:hypothetical protein DKX38_002708 [Salix brachista]
MEAITKCALEFGVAGTSVQEPNTSAINPAPPLLAALFPSAAYSWPLPSFRTPKHLQAPSSAGPGLWSSSMVKSFPEKPIKPLVGGGLSGKIYFWEQQGSAAAAEMEVEKLKLDCTRSSKCS